MTDLPNPDTDPAGFLGGVARLMRANAEAATPGPWEASDEGLTHPGKGMDVEAPGGSVASECCGYQGACLPADANHIASWHPAVALAVADLLTVASVYWPENPESLAVARAYVGSQS